ncbi:MAG: mismatch-specific DNA-glycosylase [Actinomycetota bacterium]|nr:mismatch-specific DNA-glycosylase [Actinomycetota bacterium]MDQ3573930.1 mismatch-specific DNA-glycosylase [Actinomycetota bacterium]
MALAELHWRMTPGHRLVVHALAGDNEPAWRPDDLADVIVGGGFTVDDLDVGDERLVATATRARSLPDTVDAGMRLLVCGLNPSEYAADRGVGYARPGNRFWPAAVEAGLVTRSHDPLQALRAHGVGMTDLVKRATPRADMLTKEEYRAGAARVERVVEWLQPRVICFVGLAGWRSAVDPRAAAGRQPRPFAGRPAYVMPSTSGLNAHASRHDLVKHLTSVIALSDNTPWP